MSLVLCHLIAGMLTPFDLNQIVDPRRREEYRSAIRMCYSMNATDPRGDCMRLAATRCPSN
jgi:hypothetical protein